MHVAHGPRLFSLNSPDTTESVCTMQLGTAVSQSPRPLSIPSSRSFSTNGRGGTRRFTRREALQQATERSAACSRMVQCMQYLQMPSSNY